MTRTPRAAFLHIAEQFVGQPISLFEASRELSLMAAAIDASDLLGEEGSDADAWRFLLAGLQSSDPPAFVQIGLTGRWFQIPAEYLIDKNPAEPPAALTPMEAAAGYAPDMNDQPVAIWRSTLDLQLTLLQAVADARRRVGADRLAPDSQPVPFPAQSSDPLWPEDLRTGLPGRASPAFLIDQEFRRRVRDKEVAGSLADQARLLVDWFKREERFANLQPPTPGTIENRIRGAYKAWRNPTK